MRSLILSVSTGAVLLASGCMFLPDYDFSYIQHEGSSTSGSSTTSTMTGTSSSEATSGGGAGPSSSGSTGADVSTSTSGAGGALPMPVPVALDIPPGTTAFAADDNKVYFVTKTDPTVDHASLFQIDEGGGGSAESMLTDLPASPAMAIESNHLAWLHNPVSKSNQQVKWSTTPLAKGVSNQGTTLNDHLSLGVAVFGAHMYATTATEVWSAPFISTTEGPKNHGGFSPIGPIVADSARVYWLDSSGVLSLSLNGVGTNENRLLHSPLMDSPMKGIGVYSGDVYWATAAGAIFKCPKDQSCNSVNPQPYKRYDGTVPLNGLLIDNGVAYASTATSVIAVNLIFTGDPNKDGGRKILDGRKKIVALFTNTNAIFVADEDPSSKKIVIYRTPKAM